MSGIARATVQIDDGRIRVTRYELGPGDRIPRHRHTSDYLVVPLTDGEFVVVDAGGSATSAVAAGQPYRRPAGAEHELVNGEHPYSFIEIEFLSQEPTQPRSM